MDQALRALVSLSESVLGKLSYLGRNTKTILQGDWFAAVDLEDANFQIPI